MEVDAGDHVFWGRDRMQRVGFVLQLIIGDDIVGFLINKVEYYSEGVPIPFQHQRVGE
jgi:hypothetical protein